MNSHAIKCGLIALTSLLLAVCNFTPTFNRDAGLVSPEQLQSARGTVERVTSGKYGVRFHLAGNTATFTYPSAANGNDILVRTFSAAGSKEVAILYEPPAPDEGWSLRDGLSVWQVTVDGQMIRSVEATRAGLRTNNLSAPVLFWPSLALALGFGVAALLSALRPVTTKRPAEA